MNTDRPRSIPSNVYKFVILSLVTLLQKDIVWGKGNKVVGDSCDEPTSSASNPATPKGQKGRGRPRKSSTEETRLLFAALKGGKMVERNERQSKDLENLKAGYVPSYSVCLDFVIVSQNCRNMVTPMMLMKSVQGVASVKAAFPYPLTASQREGLLLQDK